MNIGPDRYIQPTPLLTEQRRKYPPAAICQSTSVFHYSEKKFEEPIWVSMICNNGIYSNTVSDYFEEILYDPCA